MPHEQRLRLKPGLAPVLALLLAGLTPLPAHSQETVYIGGRDTGPAVEVDYSALAPRGGIPIRRTRPGPPDILPHDPANGPQARAATIAPLPPPMQPSPAASPAVPPPITGTRLPVALTPMPLKQGLTPSAAPVQPVASSGLNPAAQPPRPIAPARRDAPAVSAPAAAPTPAPPAALPQAVAALPAGLTPAKPAAAPDTNAATAILFAPGAIELTPDAVAQLDAVLVSLGEKQRLQLKAHAAGAADDAEVRRIALKRALSVRSHLLAKGMESTRIDVRALGPAGDAGPDDRLDVIVVAP